MKKTNSLIYSEEVLEFARSSQNFCKWIEGPVPSFNLFIIRGLQLLTDLYSRVMAIPEFDPVFEETEERYVTEEDWSKVYQQISSLLGPVNEYNDIAGKDEFDRSEVITRTISEDISDIYQDIRDFIEVFRNSPEEIMIDALWECKSNFSNSWGEKVLRVAKAMHTIYVSGESAVDEGEVRGTAGKKINTKDWFITKRQQEFGEEDENIPE